MIDWRSDAAFDQAVRRYAAVKRMALMALAGCIPPVAMACEYVADSRSCSPRLDTELIVFIGVVKEATANVLRFDVAHTLRGVVTDCNRSGEPG